MYKIIIGRSAAKDLERLPNSIIKRVSKVIDKLSNQPRPSGCKKMKRTKENLWRIRVGDYRIVYAISDEIKIIDIRRIRHRKEVYK